MSKQGPKAGAHVPQMGSPFRPPLAPCEAGAKSEIVTFNQRMRLTELLLRLPMHRANH